MNAAMVQRTARATDQSRDGGSKPTSPLHSIVVGPIPFVAAKELLERKHYLHSLPGGTWLAFGVLLDSRLLGAITFGAGPFQAYQLVEGARPDDCATLTRLWLSDELPGNGESRVLGIVIRALRRHTNLRFLVAYSDPSEGHVGRVYQASNWLYTGLSSVMPLYDVGDGKARHSRSLAHAYGSHSIRHFAAHGISVRLVPQPAKHRYIYFLDPAWRCRLRTPVLPYPKGEVSDEGR